MKILTAADKTLPHTVRIISAADVDCVINCGTDVAINIFKRNMLPFMLFLITLLIFLRIYVVEMFLIYSFFLYCSAGLHRLYVNNMESLKMC